MKFVITDCISVGDLLGDIEKQLVKKLDVDNKYEYTNKIANKAIIIEIVEVV